MPIFFVRVSSFLRNFIKNKLVHLRFLGVVGDDDAPVLALKGLRLKSMAPVAEEDAFTLDR